MSSSSWHLTVSAHTVKSENISGCVAILQIDIMHVNLVQMNSCAVTKSRISSIYLYVCSISYCNICYMQIERDVFYYATRGKNIHAGITMEWHQS